MGKVKSAKGKSKKITWKKIRHDDVEDFLEEKRRDERLGIKEKTDEELFFVDALGFDDDYGELTKRKREAEQKRVLRSKDGPLVDLSALRCFKILKPDSAVKDPVIKRNPIKKGGQKKTVDMKLKDELRYFRKREKEEDEEPKKEAASEGRDLWGEVTEGPKELKILNNEWLTDETKRSNLKGRSVWKPSNQKNLVAAIEVPHPGLSYNPSFAHHQELLAQIVEKEQEKAKKEEKIRRATAVTKVVGDGTIPELKDEPEEEEEEEDDKTKIKKLAKPKTKQQRRKEREQIEKDMMAKAKKDVTKKESEVFRIKTLTKKIKAVEEKNKTRLSKKVEKKLLHEKKGTRALSRYKFQDKEAVPLLSDQLPKGLVDIDVGLSAGSTGDLLVDRFKSLQKRNVIETRIKQKKPRANKPKIYIRDSDKMEWEKTGMWNGEKLLETNSGRRRRPPQRF